MTVQDINNEAKAIFGSYDYETEVEALPAYMERLKKQGEEMDRFIESLPNWVDDSEYFNLYLMQDNERESWLAKNSPYFQRTTVTAKPITVGNIRI
jgi:hypothetical protein